MRVEVMRQFQREIARAQHMETFVRLGKIRVGLLDDHAGLGETHRGDARDVRDLWVDRRNAEIARISDALRLPARTCRIDKGLFGPRLRQHVAAVLAEHRVEHQRHVLDVARHRSVDAERRIDGPTSCPRDAADGRAHADDAAKTRGVT